jgi:carboxymethylenebutenolidase
MDQQIIDIYDDYVHRHFDRRLFLDRLAKAAGGMGAAMALLPLLQSNYALAETIAAADPRLKAGHVTFDGASGPLKAYLAEPTKSGKRGGVVVIHQNRGLNAHIEDIARRLAVDGYNALAVDFLSPLGGTPADENAAMQMFGKLDKAQTTANAIAAVKHLRGLAHSNGKVGAVGFCWGGGVIHQLAVNDPTLNAGVVYYGTPAEPSEAAKVHAPLLMNYADAALDKRNGELAPPYAEALKTAGKDYQIYFYEGAQHAFNDDTNAARYNKAAAELAWSRTQALFKRTLV